MNSKPTLPLIHQLGRTGGTVICKCIGSMNKVALLSEIHPLGMSLYNPFIQANEWYKVFTEKDVEFINSTEFDFCEAIQFIYEKLTAHNKIPVIRDLTHLDYYGIPYIDNPQCKLLLAERLKKHFDLYQFANVRHPIDQYISTKSLAVFSKDDRMNIPMFLSGYLAFAKQAKSMGFIRYEDFTLEPDNALQIMCAQLRIEFDPDYKDKWYLNTCITGDVDKGDNYASRALREKEIVPLPRREAPIDLVTLFRKHDAYHAALDLLGYENK
jgi:hypothetical protein